MSAPGVLSASEAAGVYKRRREQLRPTIDQLATSDDGHVRCHVSLSLRLALDWLPSRRQYLISMGTGIENHVVYLSLERLCLQAVGRESLLPRERYAALCEFEIVLHALFGGVCSLGLHRTYSTGPRRQSECMASKESE